MKILVIDINTVVFAIILLWNINFEALTYLLWNLLYILHFKRTYMYI